MRHNHLFTAAALVVTAAVTAPYYAGALSGEVAFPKIDNMYFEFTDAAKTELRLMECELPEKTEDSPYEPMAFVPGVVGDAKVTSIDPLAFRSPDGAAACVWIPRSTGISEEDLEEISKNTNFPIRFEMCEAAVDGLVFEKNPKVQDELSLVACYAVGDIVVPETVDGMTVTGISESAFENNQYISDVSLPDTVYSMGSKAFCCSSVSSVNIPQHLYVIPKQAFYKCTQLEKVGLHENITRIDPEAFSGCPFRLSEEYEELLFGVGSSQDTDQTGTADNWRYAFNNIKGSSCMILTKYTGKATDLVLPTTLNNSEVYGCIIDLPDCVDSLTVPDTIREINVSKLSDQSLKKLIMKGGDTGISGRFAGSKIEEAVISGFSVDSGGFEVSANMFKNCSRLQTVTYISGDSDFRIQNSAFMDCTSLSAVDLPDNCTSADIRMNAFDGCTSLKELGDFGKLFSVYTESRAFAETGLQSPVLENWKAGAYAFSGCKDMTEVTVSDSTIGESAFQRCYGLKSAELNGKTVLLDKAFEDCTALENVYIGADVTSRHSFMECPSLYKINGVDAYDTEKKEFNPDCADLVYKHFAGSNDVGFINLYVQDRVKAVVAECITDDMTDIEKVRVLHDWVCRNAEYDTIDPSDKLNHADISVFLRGVTVCEGYARALDLLLQEAGVDSCCVSSTDHEWNIVRIGDQYFHVDTTWDDGDKIGYYWFLKSDDELKAEGGSHASWKSQVTSSLHKQCFDSVPKCSYSVGDVNKDGGKNVADLVSMSNYLLGKGGLDEGSEALSDLNFDGRTDTFDLVALRRKVAES